MSARCCSRFTASFSPCITMPGSFAMPARRSEPGTVSRASSRIGRRLLRREQTLAFIRSRSMPSYTPPLRDMQFVLHEVLGVADQLKALPAYADIDADTINAVLEEG